MASSDPNKPPDPAHGPTPPMATVSANSKKMGKRRGRPPLKAVFYTPNEFRVFFSVIINFVTLLHEEKKVLHPFSLENLVIKGEKLLFHNVLTRNQSLDPNTAKIERGNDYLCIHRIIDKIYEERTLKPGARGLA